MASRFRFTLGRKGIGQILKGEQGRVPEVLEAKGRRVLSAAGPGHEMRSERGPNRWRVSVGATTGEAMRAEVERGNLTNAINAARG